MGNAECAPLRVRRVVQELRMVEACARRPIAARIRAALLGDAQWRVGLAAKVLLTVETDRLVVRVRPRVALRLVLGW